MPFRTAISGLQAAQTDLNVIGNNVANANTTGFKRSRAEFQDVYAVSNMGLTATSPGRGVDTARVAQQFGQGNISFTDNALDLAISGPGFFMLDDNGTRTYSRDGAFGLDRDGYIVNARNQRMQAYGADAAGNILGSISSLQLTQNNIPPQATAAATLAANFDANATPPAVAIFNPADANSFTCTMSSRSASKSRVPWSRV